jgi:ABC-type glycerol-3-phosphate transport system substrate-binding protein
MTTSRTPAPGTGRFPARPLPRRTRGVHTRRAFLLGAGAALGAPLLGGCGTGSASGLGPSPPPGELEYLVVGDQDWMSRATDDLTAFAATDPGFTVTTRYVVRSRYDDEATPLVFAENPPGVMWFDISRARSADLIAARALTDLTGLWAEALPEVDPATADWYTVHGRRYAVPLDIVLYPLICYDVTLFGRLGITPPPEDTRSWSEAEFLDACAALRSAGLDPLAVAGLDLSGQVAEAIAGTLLSPQELQHYTVDAWQAGSRYRYTDAAWVQVFTRLREWARAGVFQPRAAWADQVSAQRAFVGGMSGMVGGGSWTVGNVTGLTGGAGIDLDWMLFPTVTYPGRLRAFPGDGAVIPAASAHREQAERLLAFLLREDRMRAAATTYGHLPPVDIPGLVDVLDPRVMSMLRFSTRLGGACMNWPTALDAPYARACRSVLAGTRTPREAGQDMEDAASLARAELR